MLETRQPPPPYVPHDGTVRISGSTRPWGAACCALHFLSNGKSPIDFLAIGGNANQQATKAMVSFAIHVPKRHPGYSVAFVPLMFSTETVSPIGDKATKTCTVWRTIIRVDA